MKKIMLCCNAGMSTSLLVQKMQAEVANRGLDFEKEAAGRFPVEVINMVDYGRMNAAGIIDHCVSVMG